MSLEFTTTRANPGVDPVLNAWLVEVPIDLLAAATAAGLMILAGLQLLVVRPNQPKPMVTCTVGPMLGVLLLSLGLTALFLDLSHKLYVWRLYLTFEVTSPMSWGSYLMLGSYGALLLNLVAHLPVTFPRLVERLPIIGRTSDFIFAQSSRIAALGWINLGLGFSLGIYTGTLLSTMRARPLWNSPLLGPIFLISGLVAAAAVLHAVLVLAASSRRESGKTANWRAHLARWTGGHSLNADVAPLLRWLVVALLALQFVTLGLYGVGLLSAPEVGQRALADFLSGRFALPFWIFVVGLGTLAPLVLGLFEIGRRVRATIIPALLVLLGAFALRYILVFAGQESHWTRSLAGF